MPMEDSSFPKFARVTSLLMRMKRREHQQNCRFSIDDGRLDKIENGRCENTAVSRDVQQTKGVSDE